MAGNPEKASYYISQLDKARVNGSWSEFPELVRKVNKHAPHRKVLVQTATAEHEIATGSDTTRRPETSTGSQPASLTNLSTTLRENAGNDQDCFQGKTCLLWSRWVALEGGAGTAGFDIITAVRDLAWSSITTWTKICVVKSAYIEGTSCLRNGRPSEAQRIFDVALSNLQTDKDLVLTTPQLAYWSEQLLAQLATASDTPAESGTINVPQMDVLRYWGLIASKTQETPASRYRNSSSHLSRLPIWQKYYECLLVALDRQSQIPGNADSTNRTQLATDIRRVERAYENELLRTVKFPTASQTNAAVEKWVEQTIRTWQLLCGPQWRDAELGEGGRNTIGRNMLDVLYRAASKTFQSTLILRRLFQVHLSLGEFDLAYRAFDTYIELVDRGRVRVAKSKTPEPGHESDEVVIAVISEAITSLCKFGRQPEARKAYDLCLKLEEWLVAPGMEDSALGFTRSTQGEQLNDTDPQPKINSHLLQIAHRALGTGKANWARWTPISESRSEMQQEALASLRKACSQSKPEIETLYTMSLLLAETRDINGAIAAAKQALAMNTNSSTQSAGWVTERKLVSQWHLLALLLSSRQDFDSATKGCVAAFEQFAIDDIQVGPGRNSSVVSNIEKQFNNAVSGFVSELECDELQRIIEVRITELALTELIDGPEEALNSSNELLGLFSRLFAHIQVPLETPTTTRSIPPPKTSASTARPGTRASMFGRRRHGNQADALKEKNGDIASIDTDTTRPSTRANMAPVIQVTTEDEKPPNKRHHLRKSYDSSRSKTVSESGSRKLSNRLSHRGQDEKRTQLKSQPPAPSEPVSIPGTVSGETNLPTSTMPLDHAKSAGSRQELPKVEHNLASHRSVPPPASHDDQPPQQDVRLPTVHAFTNATSPPTRFPKSYAQKQALMILAKIWLIIATLYRRANMFDDAKEAREEAAKAAAKIETIVGAVDHSARAFAEAGWGAGSKSADEVWADVFCEKAELQLAIYKHKVKEDKSTTNEDLRTAVDHYEQCLMFVPNHSGGIIGLSNILLDSYERKVDLGRRVNDGRLQLSEQEHSVPTIVLTSEDSVQLPANGTTNTNQPSPLTQTHADPQLDPPYSRTEEDLKKTPENLNRIAARDRAYGLLSTLTKLGTGWDDSAAWFALARAHELGGEIDKAKSVLWWCIELEDTKPIRHWRNLGYTL